MWRAWLVLVAVIQVPCLTMAQGMLVAGWHGDVGSGNDQVRSAPGRRILDVAKAPSLVATRPAAGAGGSRRAPLRLRRGGRAAVFSNCSPDGKSAGYPDPLQDHFLGSAHRLRRGA